VKQNKPASSILWAPWRKSYILHLPRKKKTSCIFCDMLRSRNDQKNYIVKRTAHAFAVLNLYPYNNGHVLIVPRRHVAEFGQLKDVELLDLIKLQNDLLLRLKKRLKPHGFNVGANLGIAAGAGVPGHLHIHLVPRWPGDTNFMPVVGKAKVISESLKSLYERLIS